jgi:DNA-directed RNA polymerase subunit RPC12/RpoP
MDRAAHHAAVQRALELGRAADPAALPELVRLLALPSAEVRRLAASAIGKLSGFGADPDAAVQALAPVALRDPHPQARQYALKALKTYGTAAAGLLNDLRDQAERLAEKDYVRQAAQSAAEAIAAAMREAEGQTVHRCLTCGKETAPDEAARARQAFQRIYCDHCFDEKFLERRNWETHVELNKTIEAADGTLVQSAGERRIAEWLASQGIAYRYDNRFRIIKGYSIRPDFYLPEYDLYIEYWGMEGNLDYEIGMLEKKKLYQQAGKRLLSVYRRDLPDLPNLLAERLTRHPRTSVAIERNESRPSGTPRTSGVGDRRESAPA